MLKEQNKKKEKSFTLKHLWIAHWPLNMESVKQQIARSSPRLGRDTRYSYLVRIFICISSIYRSKTAGAGNIRLYDLPVPEGNQQHKLQGY